MKFTIAVYSPPAPGGTAEKALRFAREVLKQDHAIYRIFFFNDGVLNCADIDDPLCRSWSELVAQHQLDAITCIASAQKRGLQQYDHDPVSVADTSTGMIHPAFNIGGIAQLIDATAHADRVITFAG